jgi:hypothetical protein
MAVLRVFLVDQAVVREIAEALAPVVLELQAKAMLVARVLLVLLVTAVAVAVQAHPE